MVFIPWKNTRAVLKPGVHLYGFVLVLFILKGNLSLTQISHKAETLQPSSLPLVWLSLSALPWTGTLEITCGSGAKLGVAAGRGWTHPAAIGGDGQASSTCCRAGAWLLGTPTLLQVSSQGLLGTPNLFLGPAEGSRWDILREAIWFS